MTDLFARLASLPPPALAALGLALGFGFGLLHFASLRRVAALYASGTAAGRALALQLARIALLVLVLSGLAALGATPLIAGAAGVFAARLVVLRRREG